MEIARVLTPDAVSLSLPLLVADAETTSCVHAIGYTTSATTSSSGSESPHVSHVVGTTHERPVYRKEAASSPRKRKRKRRLTAKQQQVVLENQRDDSQLLHLTLDVNDVKQQVRDLLVQRRVCVTRAITQRRCARNHLSPTGALRTMQHLFEVFRTGYRAWTPLEAAFLSSTIAQDIAISADARGADMFYEQWRRYKHLLLVQRMDVWSADVVMSDTDACVVECRGEFEGCLTQTAIDALFPHISSDTTLLARVVNCRFVCPTRTLLYFDAAGRIVQYDAHADMFTCLQRLLAANPVDVIKLMASARISTDGSTMLPPLPHSTAMGSYVRDLSNDVTCSSSSKSNGGQDATSNTDSVPRGSVEFILSPMDPS